MIQHIYNHHHQIKQVWNHQQHQHHLNHVQQQQKKEKKYNEWDIDNKHYYYPYQLIKKRENENKEDEMMKNDHLYRHVIK